MEIALVALKKKPTPDLECLKKTTLLVWKARIRANLLILGDVGGFIQGRGRPIPQLSRGIHRNS